MNSVKSLVARCTQPSFDFDYAYKELERQKKSLVAAGDEEGATAVWGMERILSANKLLQKAYNQLRKEDYYNAWCSLDEIDRAINNLANNCHDYYQYVKDIHDTTHSLQTLFPYRLFTSYEMLITKSKCSICGSEISIRQNCGHVLGKVYGGEMCCHIVEDGKLLGFSLVTNPENKYAVLFPQDKSGKKVDQYDYSILKDLMKKWKNPYDFIRIIIGKKKIDRTLVDGYPLDRICPCGSGKLFGECCYGKPSIEITNYTIQISKRPPGR